jgi:stage II sporulation protein R
VKLNRERLFSAVRNAGSLTGFLSAASRFILAVLAVCVIYGGCAQKEIADNIVRLHIIAGSDSAEDQAMKLKVRDAVLRHMSEKYPDGATREETAQYLKSSLPELTRVSNAALKDNGSNETAVARYGVFPFPTKQYDNVVLPAGMYEAVRIEIGEAKGRNWWCVMFPPLCIADDNSVRMSKESEAQLRASLGDDTFALVTDGGRNDSLPLQVRFKIIEIIQASRIKLTELIAKLF